MAEQEQLLQPIRMASALLLGSVFIFPALPATAADTVIDTAVSVTQVLGAGDNLSVTDSGSITGANPAVVVSGVAAGTVDNSGIIAGTTAIFITGGSLSGGLTNTGTIEGIGGTAISLNGLTGATPIYIYGGQILGDVIDDDPNNNFSPVTIAGDFTTGGNFDVSDLDVSPGATLTFGGPHTLSVGATLNTFGEIVTAAGSSVTGGLTTVEDGGRLTVADDFSINSGFIRNLGTVFIGAGATLTTLGQVGGTGEWVFEVDDAISAFGSLVLTSGTVNLADETVSVSVGTGSLSDGDEMLIIDGAAGIVSGPGGTLTAVSDNSYLWDFEIADGTIASTPTDNTDLFLFVTQAHELDDIADTPNNKDVGRVLNSMSSTAVGVIEQILENINNADTEEALNDILESTQSTSDGGNVTAAVSVARGTANITRTRLAALRGSPSGPSGLAAGDEIDLGLGGWVQTFGQGMKQDTRDNIDGYEADTYGFAFGIDTTSLFDKTVLGIAMSYAETNVDSENANTTETGVGSFQLSLYGDYDLDERTYIAGSFAYIHGENNTTRYNVGGVPGLTARGDFESHQLDAQIEAGRRFDFKGMNLTPGILAHYMVYEPERYRESGAGNASLIVDGETLNQFELGIRAEAGWRFERDSGAVIEPVLHFAYRHDFIGDPVAATSSFVGGGGAFKTEGFSPARDSFNLGMGLTYTTAGVWELSAAYDYEFKADYDAHAAYLRARRKL